MKKAYGMNEELLNMPLVNFLQAVCACHPGLEINCNPARVSPLESVGVLDWAAGFWDVDDPSTDRDLAWDREVRLQVASASVTLYKAPLACFFAFTSVPSTILQGIVHLINPVS